VNGDQNSAVEIFELSKGDNEYTAERVASALCPGDVTEVLQVHSVNEVGRTQLVSAHSDGKLRLWRLSAAEDSGIQDDLESPMTLSCTLDKTIHQYRTGVPAEITCLSKPPKLSQLLSFGLDGQIHVTDLVTGKEVYGMWQLVTKQKITRELISPRIVRIRRFGEYSHLLL
jgi:WD40 repeat protein